MAPGQRGSFHRTPPHGHCSVTAPRCRRRDREHLLAHRSGIGDYRRDEEDRVDQRLLMPVLVRDLATTDDYVRILDAPTVFPAGERFATTTPAMSCSQHSPRQRPARPFRPRGGPRMPTGRHTDTAFLRSDELPGRVAQGHLRSEGLWTNVLHPPVRGNGMVDSTTVADLHVRSGRRSSPDASCARRRFARMVSPHSDWPEESRRYGLGFHLHAHTDEVFPRGLRRRSVFLSRYRPSRGPHLHGDRQLVEGAGHEQRPSGAPGWVTGRRCPRRCSTGSEPSPTLPECREEGAWVGTRWPVAGLVDRDARTDRHGVLGPDQVHRGVGDAGASVRRRVGAESRRRRGWRCRR